MSEISSGLVAVAWQVRNGWSSCDLYRTLKSATEDRDMLQKRADFAGNLMAYRVEPLVRLSDAEAIIAQKDAEILEQCRINGMGAERESALLGKVAQQSAALKIAREALERSSKRDIAQWHNWDFDGDDDGKPPTQLNDPVLQAQLQALAAINEVLKGE